MCFAVGSLVFCVSGFETSSGGSSRIRFACMVFPIVICRAGEGTISRRPALGSCVRTFGRIFLSDCP